MTTQNAFHPQTAEFAAAVTRSLPRVSSEIMQGWITNPAGLQEALAHALCPEKETPSLTLLEPISTVIVPARNTPFIAKDKFVLGTSATAPVKISSFGGNFRTWFLDKTEELLPEQTLRYAKLRQASPSAPIITELGGEEKAETTLAELFFLMEKQKNCEDDPLLTDGSWNIFHIKDVTGVLRAVDVRWGGDGWDVRARSTLYPSTWGGGRRVFSRNS